MDCKHKVKWYWKKYLEETSWQTGWSCADCGVTEYVALIKGHLHLVED